MAVSVFDVTTASSIVEHCMAQSAQRRRASVICDFHDLRHTFISMMGERGVPLQVVGAMVGHMSPAIWSHTIRTFLAALHGRQSRNAGKNPNCAPVCGCSCG